MPDEDRLDLDAIKSDLLKDVEEASRLVKERKAKDKAANAKLAAGTRDRTIMYTIVVFAAVVIIAIAYWKTFMSGSSAQDQPPQQQRVHTRPAPVQPQQPAQVQQPTAPVYQVTPRYAPTRPPAPTYHPPRVITPAEPTQPTEQVPPETPDEGQEAGGM